jgi:trehalose-phosphatase
MKLPCVLDEHHGLATRIEGAAGLLLFLDFDGTLAPIVSRPALAALPDATRDVLNGLAGLPAITLAILSGRSLEDLKNRVGIPGLIYAGNHGLEIEGMGLALAHPAAIGFSAAVRDITDRISARAAGLEGVEIESKGLTTSVHVRRAPPPVKAQVAALFKELVRPDNPRIEITEGKMVHEIRPRVRWDKGRAASWIRDRLEQEWALPILIGDDMTDESAFTAFDDAITICVRPRRPTAASYQLNNPDDVRTFLAWLDRAWARRAGPERD